MDLMTPAQTFAAVDTAQTVTTYHGQGYSRAKFAGRCAFTGLPIYQGEPIRSMSIETRDGRQRRGFTAVRIEALFGFCGGSRGELPTSVNVFVGGMWEGHRHFLIEKLDTLQAITIVKGVDDKVSYTWDALMGKWRKGYNLQSTKQMAATLRRTKRTVLFSTRPRLALPYPA